MSVTVTLPTPLGPITVRGGDGLDPVQVVIPATPAAPTITVPTPVPPAVVRPPGADLRYAQVPGHADYPEQTIQQRLEQLIDAKADEQFSTFTYPFTNSSSILVPHHLNKYPAVSVVDSAGTVWEGDVQHLSTDELLVTLTVTFTGLVICN